MLAPIALYPDALLSQMLVAASYPMEVVEAALREEVAAFSEQVQRLESQVAVASATDAGYFGAIISSGVSPARKPSRASYSCWLSVISSALFREWGMLSSSRRRAFSGAIPHFAMRFRVTSSMIVCDHFGR